MNPIEHLWDELDCQVKKRQSTSKSDLQRILLEECNGIDRDVTQKLVESMPNRFYEASNRKGILLVTDSLKMCYSF